jgi:hypothetical protein
MKAVATAIQNQPNDPLCNPMDSLHLLAARRSWEENAILKE